MKGENIMITLTGRFTIFGLETGVKQDGSNKYTVLAGQGADTVQATTDSTVFDKLERFKDYDLVFDYKTFQGRNYLSLIGVKSVK